MKKAVKKAKAKAPATVHPHDRVLHPLVTLEALLADPPQAIDKWLLIPFPEPRFAGPANRQKFLDAVAHARVKLIHDKFGNLYDHARELSDAGGILRVEIKRIRSWVNITSNFTFVDGKKVDTE